MLYQTFYIQAWASALLVLTSRAMPEPRCVGRVTGRLPRFFCIYKPNDFIYPDSGVYGNLYYVMHNRNTYITSMKEYIDWIIQSRKTEIDRNKEDKLSYADGLFNVYYRGHASISWELNASIFREPYKDDILSEYKLLKEARARLWNELNNFSTHLEKLIYLQHYGMATRLLDVTYNPLIALYFACCSDEKDDGAVYSGFKYEKENPMIAELTAEYIFTYACTDIEEGLKQYAIKKGVQLNDFLETLFICPPFNNPRLKSQNGAFIMCPLIRNNGGKIIHNYESLNDSPFFSCNKAVVPHDKKERLLQELHIFGIDEGSVFHDIISRINTIMKVEKWKINKTNNLIFE